MRTKTVANDRALTICEQLGIPPMELEPMPTEFGMFRADAQELFARRTFGPLPKVELGYVWEVRV
jgi:hypothetical protein